MQGTYYPYFMKDALLDAEREIGDTLRTLRRARLCKTPLSKEPREKCEAEAGIVRLFEALRSTIMTGRWRRLKGCTEDALRNFRSHKKDLRRAYRDARITDIRIDGDQATIKIAWGVYGYTFDELRVVRRDDAWVFATAPWANDAVMSGPPEEEYIPKRTSSHTVSLRMDPGTRWAVAVAVLSAIVLAVPLTIYLLRGLDPKIPPQFAHLGIMVAAVYGIAAVYITLSKEREHRLLWSFVFLMASVLHVLMLQLILM